MLHIYNYIGYISLCSLVTDIIYHKIIYKVTHDITYLLHDQTPVYSPLKSTFIEKLENLKKKNVKKCYAVIIDN